MDIEKARPLKRHPYRIYTQRVHLMKQEIQYILENGIIETSCSEWASPYVLVDKSGGSVRFCTDYRKMNQLTRTDAYPIPQIDDCIDRRFTEGI